MIACVLLTYQPPDGILRSNGIGSFQIQSCAAKHMYNPTELVRYVLRNLRQATSHPKQAQATTGNHLTQAATGNHPQPLHPTSQRQPPATTQPKQSQATTGNFQPKQPQATTGNHSTTLHCPPRHSQPLPLPSPQLLQLVFCSDSKSPQAEKRYSEGAA